MLYSHTKWRCSSAIVTCEWCKRYVCSFHITVDLTNSMFACDECRTLEKSIIIKNKTFSAAMGVEMLDLYIMDQYKGLYTKRAK